MKYQMQKEKYKPTLKYDFNFFAGRHLQQRECVLIIQTKVFATQLQKNSNIRFYSLFLFGAFFFSFFNFAFNYYPLTNEKSERPDSFSNKSQHFGSEFFFSGIGLTFSHDYRFIIIIWACNEFRCKEPQKLLPLILHTEVNLGEIILQYIFL